MKKILLVFLNINIIFLNACADKASAPMARVTPPPTSTYTPPQLRPGSLRSYFSSVPPSDTEMKPFCSDYIVNLSKIFKLNIDTRYIPTAQIKALMQRYAREEILKLYSKGLMKNKDDVYLASHIVQHTVYKYLDIVMSSISREKAFISGALSRVKY
jgi:hypothetical protein